MDDAIIDAVFQPKPSKQEAKADVTTRVAREILDGEVNAREAKTERLRAARLAMQESAPSLPAKKTTKTRVAATKAAKPGTAKPKTAKAKTAKPKAAGKGSTA